MATIAENLATAKANYAATLASISASPKPSYSIDGRSYSWVEYQKFILEQMAAIDKQTASESGSDTFEGVVFGGT
ncbi:hypothetical protein UFOVP466_80 [uncultured Caudovirales phage]|uniref:Uncharacterized protein n=1 Tax=uncultured Caudovirales phage TaxID=2100421 RepID=A0A6J5MI85_9CAUD|nr:hypothetical protein UFOVP466_80 [uncultured Caudovirales phage]CAB4180431.1 hypothetical protein UFOVP1045_27 [uncultured Caudovirales phage]CAB4190636.1 hypothetical protein UFOVP1194_81 [uncultured Caudovirales phage]CAB4221840.1 hypothetical protein UFOVP1641_77 [uncultured Caudovirales phage]